MAQSVGQLIPHVLKRATAKRQQLERLQRQWARIVGRALAKHANLVSLQRGTLTIQTDEPGASFAVSLEKPRLLKQLNAGAKIEVKDIVVRAGEVPRHATRKRRQ